jgi:hypothetical protein
MAEIEGGDVSRHAFQVAYYGTDADDHSMDVEALAPALMAFGKLIREANAQINGDRAKVKVLVTSDFEHKCFNISFEVIQTIMQQIKSFLADDNIETATELLKTIGVVTGTGASLFGFLKWKKGRKVKKVQKLSDTDSSGSVVVHVEGDGNSIQITNNIFKLAENKKVLANIGETLGPIETRDAERIEFKQADKTTASYDREEVKAIIASCQAGPEDLVALDEEAPKPEIVTATLHVYSPVFDTKAKAWRFNLKKKHIYADISQTNIAKEAMRRGGSFTNDRYRVRMEVTAPDVEGGDPHYKITEVLDFTPAPQQAALPLPKPRKNTKKRR